VSLAELASADIQLRPAEAVGIVADICRQYSSGRIRGIPSPGVIRLTRDGDVVAEGPITTVGEPGLRRAALLLSDLLPEFDAPVPYRASGGLRLVVARALGTLDLPPYATLEAFCAALARFAVADLGTTVRSLFRAWEETLATRRPPEPPPALTISDIRRARRATGLSLDDLSAVADVPAARLRELEWGYLRNWRPDPEGRGQVIRYAQAAGLDEAVVLSIAWPMIEEAAALGDPQPEAVVALAPSSSQALVPAPTGAPHLPLRTGLTSWGVVAGSAAVLGLVTFGLITGAAQDKPPAKVAAVSEPARSGETRPMTPPAAPPPQPSVASRAATATPLPAVRRAAAPHQSARPAQTSRRRSSSGNRSFFRKELFRIVIK
jgi:hypothetical protein